jgi:glycine/D-amino acid oxidase-like deaminating enzyme
MDQDLFRRLASVDRRSFLRSGRTAAGFALAAQGTALRGFAQAASARKFAPVRVSRGRVIREIVGLRPFRPEGFVVAAERVGSKLVIHNYGHGGAGITLSWGTATQAVDLLKDFPQPIPARGRAPKPAQRRFAVIGCGVNGLSTARMLQRRYQDGPGTVTIYARDLPPETTSNIAAGYWSPVSLYDDEAVTSEWKAQYNAAARISNRAFQLLVGPEYGVRWLDIFTLHQDEASIGDLAGPNELYPNQMIHKDPANYFGAPVVRQFSSMIIEPPIYLRSLLRDFYNAGGRLVVKDFKSRDEVMRLAEPVIFNCSGLGARALFGDEKLIPARGQLEVLLPQPEIDYAYIGQGHMFPRSDGIVLGGTFDRDDWTLDVNPQQSSRIINTHIEMMKRVRPAL